mmetsp:Transcript_32241/g.63515  ORF Transcript_32241/g.63515 Transcript_32241/m.63515 type:complete len:96 (-) Transcript_32241:129-416(-)
MRLIERFVCHSDRSYAAELPQHWTFVMLLGLLPAAHLMLWPLPQKTMCGLAWATQHAGTPAISLKGSGIVLAAVAANYAVVVRRGIPALFAAPRS